MTLHGEKYGGNVVCEQAEWVAIEAARPGYHTLLHSGLKTEQEAEKLARGTAGDSYRRGIGKKPGAREAADRLPPAPPAPPVA
jgi:hypothetical protein